MWNLLKINNKYTKTTSLTAFIREIGVLFSGRLKQGIKSVNGGNHKFVNRLKLFSGKNQVLVNDFFTCAYQNMRNVSFLGHFVYVLNEWSLWLNIPSTQPALTPKQCSIPPNSQENLCFNQVFQRVLNKFWVIIWSYNKLKPLHWFGFGFLLATAIPFLLVFIVLDEHDFVIEWRRLNHCFAKSGGIRTSGHYSCVCIIPVLRDWDKWLK